jgi:Ras family protein
MPSTLAKQRKIAIVGSRSVGTLLFCSSSSSSLQAQHVPLTHLRLCIGKSSLAVRYVDGHFVESYYPTIENTFSKEIRYKGQEYATEIVDTAGQDEYSILNSKHFIGIHGYMLVYSVSSLPSFEMVQVIRDKILNHLVCSPVPLLHSFLH